MEGGAAYEQGVRLSLGEKRFIAEISVVQTKKGKERGEKLEIRGNKEDAQCTSKNNVGTVRV